MYTHYIIIYFNASVLSIVLCIMCIYIYIFICTHIYIYHVFASYEPTSANLTLNGLVSRMIFLDRPRYPSEYRLVLDWFDQQCLGKMFFRDA